MGSFSIKQLKNITGLLHYSSFNMGLFSKYWHPVAPGCGEVGPPSCPAHRVHGRLEGADLRRAAGTAGWVTGDTDSKKSFLFLCLKPKLIAYCLYVFFSHPKFGHGGSFWVDEYLCFHRFPANLTHIFSARHVPETSIFWLFSLFSLSGCSRK